MDRILEMLFAFLVYLAAIVPATLLVGRAETLYSKKRTGRFFLLMALAVLLPCLIAAFRGETVGTDVLIYARPAYLRAAAAKSFPALIRMKTRYEPGYLAISYLASHVLHSFNAMLFLTHFMILTPIYIGAHQLKGRVPAWSVVLCYLAFFYVMTFNIMRQGIASAFIFLMFVELQNKKLFRAILCAVLSILFHSSAPIGIALVLFVLWFRNLKSTQTRVALLLVVTLLVPLLMSRWTQILTALVNIGIIKSRYLYYIRKMGGSSFLTEISFGNYLELLFRWLGVLVPVFFYKKAASEDGSFRSTALIGTLLATMIYTSVFFALHSSYGYRVSFYLEPLFAVWMSTLAKDRITVERFPAKTGVMLISAFVCLFVCYAWRGFHGTMPFFFQIYHF